MSKIRTTFIDNDDNSVSGEVVKTCNAEIKETIPPDGGGVTATDTIALPLSTAEVVFINTDQACTVTLLDAGDEGADFGPVTLPAGGGFAWANVTGGVPRPFGGDATGVTVVSASAGAKATVKVRVGWNPA